MQFWLRRIAALAGAVGWIVAAHAADSSLRIASPDGRIVAVVQLDGEGAPRYTVERDGRVVLRESKLGLVREDVDLSRALTWHATSAVEPIRDEYELLTSKRRLNRYVANRASVNLRAHGGQQLDIVFQVSNDGVAFRYRFPESNARVHRIREEKSSFNFQPGTLTWLQPISAAKTGFAETNPSYEETYEREVPVGVPSPTVRAGSIPRCFARAIPGCLSAKRRWAGTMPARG
jgi:hypothetical protein